MVWLKRLGILILILILMGGCTWWSIGSNWRTLIMNMPKDNNVLFWSQAEREIGFRMTDQISFMVKSRDIPAGPDTRPLPEGKPLDMPLDMDAYFETQNLAAMVIVHNGQVRYERYGLDFKPDERWTSFSVAKSFTSSLVGAAIKDGYIQSVEDNVADYIPGLIGSAYDGVTIAQLLTMTSGVQWNEDYSDPNSDVAKFNNHVASDDLPVIVSYMQGLPRAHEPGTRWNYSTGETNLIGLLVRTSTGKSLTNYLSEKIWQPYGMEAKATWLLDDDGNEISGCCIQATTRDFARFGLFALDKGADALPEGWIDTASQPLAEIDRAFELAGSGYGYQWWINADGSYRAGGIFGQGIFIDPARNLVIATNGNWTTAIGLQNGERARRADFNRAIQAVIDTEG